VIGDRSPEQRTPSALAKKKIELVVFSDDGDDAAPW